MMALWQRLSSVGVDASLPAAEQRRIRLCNQSCLIGSLTCVGLLVAYVVMDARVFRWVILLNVAGGLAMLLGIALDARRRYRLARIACLAIVNAHVFAACLLLSNRTGFQYYYFVFAPVAFLLYSSADERFQRFVFPVVSAACFVWIQFVASPEDAPIRLTPMVALGLNVVSALLTLCTITFVVHLFHQDAARAERLLAEEHERSERLLLNILPVSISRRLKDDDQSIADGFGEATVLFADLVGFTQLSGTLPPAELVGLLNRVFSEFDQLTVQHGLEKIKTIGDAYMVASGLPEARPDHTQIIARMALDMRAALDSVNRATGRALAIRIGVHTGPVVAGVIGKKKFIYDLWGDTVNVASRMESHGIPGEIQVTEDVYRRIRDDFELVPRGPIEIKGKGVMETYLLTGPKR